MKKFIKEIITCNHGTKSSKRLTGVLMVGFGTIAKLFLIAYGAVVKIQANFTLYDKLDATADTLIYAGAALLGLGVTELFKKK